MSAVDDMLGEEIAVGDSKFYITTPPPGKRRIRSGETNLGDFVADGIYATSMRSKTSTATSPS